VTSLPSDAALFNSVISRLGAVLGGTSTDGANIVLIGGQAVLLWQARLRPYLHEPVTGITTDDVDLATNNPLVMEACATALEGILEKPSFDHHTPNLGTITFTTEHGTTHRLDILSAPFGTRIDTVRHHAVPLTHPSGVTMFVIRPDDMLEASIAKLAVLRPDDPMSVRHVRSSIATTRAFCEFLLDTDPENLRVVHSVNRHVAEIAESLHARNTYEKHGLDALDALMIEHRLVPEATRTEWYPRVCKRVEKTRGAELLSPSDDDPSPDIDTP
jgi:hypothetical protein